MDGNSQLDLFAEDAAFRALPLAEFPEQIDRIDSSVSADGSVRFRYGAKLKKSIRCRRGGFFKPPELEFPEYMAAKEFAPVRELAVEWAHRVFRRKTAKNKEELHSLLSRIWMATDQILVDAGKSPVAAGPRIPPIRPVGEFYDLNQIFAAVNEQNFGGTLNARITWSARAGGLSFHTVRKDPLTGETVNVISISRGYDFKNCPLYAITGVVFHECLHIAIPPVVVNGRRIVHGKNFRQRERLYIYYEQWIKWHREVLPRNVRAMMGERKLAK